MSWNQKPVSTAYFRTVDPARCRDPELARLSAAVIRQRAVEDEARALLRSLFSQYEARRAEVKGGR